MIEILIIVIFNVAMFFLMMFGSKYYSQINVNYLRSNPYLEINDINKSIQKTYFWKYILWACVQQAIVISIYYLFQWLKLSVDVSISICALLFLIFHYPNIILMFAVMAMETFLLLLLSSGGYIIIPFMVLTHAFLASTLLRFYPPDITKNFCVWFSFFNQFKNK